MKRSILIVDDDAWIRSSLIDALSMSGNEVHRAEGADAALAVLAESPADIVLTDVRMPGMDGLELLGLLRERMPDVPPSSDVPERRWRRAAGGINH